jgi:hypothetical protein
MVARKNKEEREFLKNNQFSHIDQAKKAIKQLNKPANIENIPQKSK